MSPGSLVDNESAIVRDGAYAARSISAPNNSRAAAFKSLGSSYNKLAVQMDIMVVSANLPTYGHRDFIQFYLGGSWRSSAKIGARRGLTSPVYMAVWDEGPYDSSNYLPDQWWEPGRWYKVELFADQGPAEGQGTIEYWVDGVRKAYLTNQNLGTTPWGRVAVGNYSGEPGVIDMIMDNVIIDDEFIPFM